MWHQVSGGVSPPRVRSGTLPVTNDPAAPYGARRMNSRLTTERSRHPATRRGLLILLLWAIVSTGAKGDVVSLWIEVQGTRCPPCARGLEDAVRQLKGVTSAKFGGIGPQKLEIGVKKGRWVDLDEVWRLIQRQGYRVRKENTHLVLRGSANRVGDAWQLTVKDGEEVRTIPIELASKSRNGKSAGNLDLSAVPRSTEVEIDGTIGVKDKQLVLVAHRISSIEEKQ